MGFKVDDEYKNYTAKQIIDKIEAIAKNKEHNLAKYNCLVVVFLSHGEMGTIYGSDNNTVSIGEMQAKFNSNDCPSMHGKPKIFILDACRIARGM